MKKIDILNRLYKSQQDVFSLKELCLMFPEIKYVNLKRRLNYFVRKNNIISPTRGVFAKDNYRLAELAEKIYTPAYVSLETVLAKEGVIFQKYESIFLVSYLSREIKIENNKIIYKRLRSEILLNNLGVEKKENYFVASKERAFTDAVYLYRDYYFDNIATLDWKMVFKLAKIYKSKLMVKRLNAYYKLYKENV